MTRVLNGLLPVLSAAALVPAPRAPLAEPQIQSRAPDFQGQAAHSLEHASSFALTDLEKKIEASLLIETPGRGF